MYRQRLRGDDGLSQVSLGRDVLLGDGLRVDRRRMLKRIPSLGQRVFSQSWIAVMVELAHRRRNERNHQLDLARRRLRITVVILSELVYEAVMTRPYLTR